MVIPVYSPREAAALVTFSAVQLKRRSFVIVDSYEFIGLGAWKDDIIPAAFGEGYIAVGKIWEASIEEEHTGTVST